MKCLGAIVLFVVAAAAQTPPRFEVASIKPSPRPPVGPVGVRIGPSQARFTFASLKNYIAASRASFRCMRSNSPPGAHASSAFLTKLHRPDRSRPRADRPEGEGSATWAMGGDLRSATIASKPPA